MPIYLENHTKFYIAILHYSKIFPLKYVNASGQNEKKITAPTKLIFLINRLSAWIINKEDYLKKRILSLLIFYVIFH